MLAFLFLCAKLYNRGYLEDYMTKEDALKQISFYTDQNNCLRAAIEKNERLISYYANCVSLEEQHEEVKGDLHA